MAFQTVNIAKYRARDPKKASVSISPKRGLTFGFAEETGVSLKFVKGDRYGLQLGDGEDQGKARLVRDDTGAAMRKIGSGGFVINFGAGAKLGFEQAEKLYSDFRAVDPHTIEIDLPDWEQEQSTNAGDSDDDGEAESDQPSPVQAKTTPNNGKLSAAALTLHGISVDPDYENESISYEGKSMEITTNQCAVLLALLRTHPNPCGSDFLCKKTLAGMKHSPEVLQNISDALHAMLPEEVGLDVKVVKGVGLVLAKL